MTIEKFLTEYANTPLDKRDLPIGIGKDEDISEGITLNMLYNTIHFHKKNIRDSEEQIMYAIGIAENFLNTHSLTRK